METEIGLEALQSSRQEITINHGPVELDVVVRQIYFTVRTDLTSSHSAHENG